MGLFIPSQEKMHHKIANSQLADKSKKNKFAVVAGPQNLLYCISA